ncbi:YegP family protein [Soonwooa sp.]|uniref:YegP family protein n=1 Tax=Soonwooa sp. TaxID=1938592 RepID=UPI0035B18BAC
MSKYQIKKTINSQYRWVLKATNGETLITSETYTTNQNCLNGIASSKISVSDKNFERKSSISGQPYFNQGANNYQVLGTSEMYSSIAARDNGIDSVKRNAPTATIEDLS